jgi:hypothetical protein
MPRPDAPPLSSGVDPLGSDWRRASAERAEQAAATIRESVPKAAGGAVAYTKMRLRWSAAKASRETAVANLCKVVSGLLDDEDYANEPRLGEARAAAATVGDRIPSFGTLADQIDDALDALASASPAKRVALQAAAVKAIRDYRPQLLADPMLKELQNTQLGFYPIVDELAAALDSLEAALAG